ncbi:MAG: AAA family ATPase [Chloroflexi bacterium]|nr:AAA family ATPase [Chloroflexota bacterium]
MTTEIFGREGELAVVEAFLDRTADGPRALVLEGEAGIGKSALWLAGVARARERSFRVVSSQPAETERTLPNVVLGDLFGDVGPDVLDTLPAPRRRAFESALLLQEAPAVPVDPRALGVAILTILPAVARGRPLVLAIDDDQWIDPSSAGTLLFALRRLRDHPFSLLLSRRSGGPPTTHLEDAIDPTVVERLAIGPLSMEGIQLLVRRRLDIALPRPTLARLNEVSGGNPFYALELARVQSMDPTHAGTQPLAVPPSLELLVGARLREFVPSTRRALLLIAAQGRFPEGFLRMMDLAPDALDQARAANVIESTGGVIRFTHPLLASTLYQEATEEERRDAHRRLARVVDDPVHRGRHLALAAEGPNDDLATTLESAAAIARDRGMPVAAVELAEQALRLTPSHSEVDLHRRAISTSRAHSAAGDGGGARAIAADLAARAPGGRIRAEALILRAELEPPAIAVALLEAALAEAADTPALQAAIHIGLAEAGYFSAAQDDPWRQRHARASLRIAERLDDDALRANALTILALIRFDSGDPQALELAQRAYRLATPLADPRPLQRASWAVGHVLTWLGETGPAREWLEGRLADWSDHDERVRSDLLWYLALVELWSGRWSVAGEYAAQLREFTVQYGMELPYDSFPSALIAMHLGQLTLARENAEHALALGEGQQLEFFFGILAVCDAWSGNPAAALDDFVRAEQASDAFGTKEPSLRYWRAEYIETLLQLGRVDDAARVTADWETAAVRLGRQRIVAQTVRSRGLIAAARGDLPAALAMLELAAGQHEAAGDPFGRARALLALGAVKRRLRQKRSARAVLQEALTGFDALGARTWVGVAKGELARIGGRQRMEGLSPSEVSVATLVAEGRTNREIASALFLGERTVGGHLTRIYAKVGVRSRTELARTLARVPPISGGDASKVEGS